MESRNIGNRQKATAVPGKVRERMLVALERPEDKAKVQAGWEGETFSGTEEALL